MRDAADRIIYIGKSEVAIACAFIFSWLSKLSERIAMMVKGSESEFIVTDTEAEALALEANLVKHQPYFNVLLKDDKSILMSVLLGQRIIPSIHHAKSTTR